MQHPTSGMENWTQVISVQTSIEKHYWKQHSNISKGLWFPTPIFFFPWKKAGPTSRNFTLKGFISSASWPWLRACERLGNGVLMGVDLQKILENHGEKTAKMREKLFKNWDAGQQQNRHFDFYHHHQKKKGFIPLWQLWQSNLAMEPLTGVQLIIGGCHLVRLECPAPWHITSLPKWRSNGLAPWRWRVGFHPLPASSRRVALAPATEN